MAEDSEKRIKALEHEKKVLEAKNRALTSEYRALRDACPSEVLENLQVDYSKELLSEEQNKCPYCHDLDGHGTDSFECNIDDATASIDLADNTITFDNSDGSRMSGAFKIKFCPMCARKLEA